MAGRTRRFRLNKFGAGTPGSISDDGQKYTSTDRDLLDSLLASIETHDHRFRPPSESIAEPPTFVLNTTGGSLVGGFDYFYRFSVLEANGAETIASPEIRVEVPDPLPAPGAPALWADPTVLGGTLAPGTYYYALTGFRGDEESTLGPLAMASVLAGSGSITLDLPTYGDADSFQVWRMGVNDAGWTRVGIAATPNFVDDGSVPSDPCACDPGNTPPFFNTGVSSYSVEVFLPASVSTIGKLGWRLYRTTTAGVYSNRSLVHQVIETEDQWDETSAVVRSWLDDGLPLTPGSPGDFDASMHFVPFVFDRATTLPAPTGYPEFYPLMVDGTLRVLIGGEWRTVGGGGGDEEGGEEEGAVPKVSMVLTSPNGKRWVQTASDAGGLVLVETQLPGPPTPPQNVTVI